MSGFWSKHQTGTLMREPEKSALAQSGTTFDVTRVSEGSGDFGDFWEIAISVDGASRLLRFSKADWRDEIMDALAEEIESSGAAVPCSLQEFSNKAGQTGYAIGAPLPDSSTGQQRLSSGSVDDVAF